MVMHALTAPLSTQSTLLAAAPPDSLDGACRANPGIACQLVWDITHSGTAAHFTRVYLAGPVQLVLRIAFVLLLAHRLPDGRRAGDPPDHQPRREHRQRRPGALAAAASGASSGPPRSAACSSNVATMTIFTITLFIILGDLGLNLAPVLASAGVIGIAIGFGAQNLVQDFLAGIFMLLEDQYGVGDMVSIEQVSGTVEAVTLRITRVRDVNGVIWHIRNGTISKSGNESHGWARAVVDFPLPYSLDITEARPLMEEAAVAMWHDDAWSDGHPGAARGLGRPAGHQRRRAHAGHRADRSAATVGGRRGSCASG